MNKFFKVAVMVLGLIAPCASGMAEELEMKQGDMYCLAENIFHEARGESYWGQLYVFNVTVNRMKDNRWPSNGCEVVYQHKQFSWTLESREVLDAREKKEKDKFVEIIERVKEWVAHYEDYKLEGIDHYATLETDRSWMNDMDLVTKVGGHKFFNG